MEHSFKTKIRKNDIDLDSELVISDVEIKWSASIIMDMTKISDIVARVPDQDIVITVESYNEKTEEGEEKSIPISLTDVEVEYERGDVSESRALGLLPVGLKIYKGKATVVFCAYSV